MKDRKQKNKTDEEIYINDSLASLRISTLTSSVLVVAPHPDDEALGCGGAIAILRQMKLPVKVAIISDGTQSHPNSRKYPTEALRELREKESLAALKILDVDPQDITFFRLPDGNVPNLDEAEFDSTINLFQDYLNQFNIKSCIQPITKPSAFCPLPSAFSRRELTIFLPWRGDPHRDHRASWQLINAAIKKLEISPRLLEYPIWTWERQQTSDLFDSAKTWQLNISGVLDLKKQAIAQYRSQISDLIDDDPEGFRLTPEVLKHFTHPWEIYLEVI
ncbi:MAG: PIG-L deacetylase family protein [Waterburya sp.]